MQNKTILFMFIIDNTILLENPSSYRIIWLIIVNRESSLTDISVFQTLVIIIK